MCDSISVLCLISKDLPNDKRKSCNFPLKTLSNKVHASGDLRTEYVASPLTGAQYRVTPVGDLLPGSEDKRYKCEPLAGYLVEVNVPACVIGHNRLLVNGVPFAARFAFELGRYWLVQNGCTAEGLDHIQYDDAEIVDLTPTFLVEYESETESRAALYEYHKHAQAVLNKTGKVDKDGNPIKQPVYAKPAEPVGPGLKPTYSSYIKQREHAILGYVKEPNQPGATTLPVEDEDIEAEIESTHVCLLRLEPRLYAKWLRDKKLNKAVAWENNSKAYRKVFNLIRQTLRLDDQMRTTRLKSKTIETLDLNDSDQAYLAYHWKGGVVREHADFQAMPDLQRSKRFSDLKARIWDATNGIDLTIPYAVQSKQLSSDLSDRLVFSRLFKVQEHLEPYVFSPVSARVALKQLRAIVIGVLESGQDSVPQVPTFTVYRGPLPAPAKRTVKQASVKPRRSSGIGTAPLQKDEDFE